MKDKFDRDLVVGDSPKPPELPHINLRAGHVMVCCRLSSELARVSGLSEEENVDQRGQLEVEDDLDDAAEENDEQADDDGEDTAEKAEDERNEGGENTTALQLNQRVGNEYRRILTQGERSTGHKKSDRCRGGCRRGPHHRGQAEGGYIR